MMAMSMLTNTTNKRNPKNKMLQQHFIRCDVVALSANVLVLTIRKAVKRNDENCGDYDLIPLDFGRHDTVQNIRPVLSGKQLSI